MNTASFASFFTTLIWIVLFYYAFKYLLRILAPFLVKFAVQKAEKTFNEKARQFYEQQQYSNTSQNRANSTRKTEINIKDLREKNKVGEYIDFEEIK